MKTRNRILSVILALVLCVGMLPISTVTAFTETTQTYGDFTVTGDDLSGVSFADNVLTINTSTALTVSNTNPSVATDDRIEIASGISGGTNITLDGVNINTNTGPALFAQSDINLALAAGSTNTLVSINNTATDIDNKESGIFGAVDCTIGGAGALSVTGTNGFGIKAGNDLIVRDGAQVTAIGEESCLTAQNITIRGGARVTAKNTSDNNGILAKNLTVGGTGTRVYATGGWCAIIIAKTGEVAATPVTIGFTVTGSANPNEGESNCTTQVTFDTAKQTYKIGANNAKTVLIKPKAVPTAEDFTFTPPANLTYDGVPKTATVTAKDGIAGMGEITVKYEPVSTINAGTYIVKIDVAEGTEYASATNITDATWTFTVLPTIPVDPTTPTASGITYGQTLADSTLTAGWVWADATTVPTVTNNGYTAYYAIADDVNYDWTAIEGYNATEHRLERTVQVTVAKATPAVDPKPTASRVIIGGKLSDSALTGGTASVDGTFAWKDGTEVLDTAQTVTKKVVFTPDDTDNYNTVEIDVDVTVVLCDTTSGEHDHTELKHDDKDHWYECAKCGNVKADSKTAHTFEWKVDKEPTASETGLKHEECSCGAKRNIDTVISKTETDSPPTGDNSNTALWIALLFVSGFGIVATTVYGRKKRQAR